MPARGPLFQTPFTSSRCRMTPPTHICIDYTRIITVDSRAFLESVANAFECIDCASNFSNTSTLPFCLAFTCLSKFHFDFWFLSSSCSVNLAISWQIPVLLVLHLRRDKKLGMSLDSITRNSCHGYGMFWRSMGKKKRCDLSTKHANRRLLSPTKYVIQ